MRDNEPEFVGSATPLSVVQLYEVASGLQVTWRFEDAFDATTFGEAVSTQFGTSFAGTEASSTTIVTGGLNVPAVPVELVPATE